MSNISEKKLHELENELKHNNIFAKDLEIKSILGSGSGGQKVNKSETCIQIKHVPTGIVVKSQKTRSKSDNIFFAKRQLLEKILDKNPNSKSKKEIEIEKIRKQKKKRRKRSKSNDVI